MKNRLRVWLWLWLQKRTAGRSGKLAHYFSSFVFIEELQGWPLVRHLAPGRFVILAPHTGPRRYQNYGGWKPPAITAVVVGVLFFLRFGADDLGRPTNFLVPALIGVMAGALSSPFWHGAIKTRLKIHFIDGVMSWRGPGWKKYRIKLGQRWRMRVVAPHRLAYYEALQHRNFMASYPRGHHPESVFQASSELLMETGPDQSLWLPVAEFLDDLSEEQAGRLQAAIVLVTEAALEELEARS